MSALRPLPRAGRSLLLGLATVALALTAAPTNAQITPPKPGVPLHPAYLERKAQDRTAFQFQNAWIAETKRVQENRRLAEIGILDTNAPGGGVVVSGTKNVPVILGEFSNTGTSPYDVGELQDQLFDGPNPTGTMTAYYDEISYSNITLSGTVFGNGNNPYTTSQTDTYYEGGVGCNGLCGTSKVGEFIEELLIASDGTVDFSIYDNDGPDNIPNSGDDDGLVDFVAFAHPEFGGECGGNNLWSHRWVVGGWSNFPGPWTTNDPAFGGGFIQVWDYTIQPLVSCNTTDIIEIGVYAHEFGHAFGLPDLYDTNSGNGTSQGIGEWGLMGSGSYGGDGNHPETPSHMCAWAKEQLGWVQPTVVCADQLGQSLNTVWDNGTVLKVYPHGVQDSEYFLIENRVQQGFDQWIHTEGLAIWHIDNDQPGNGDETHKLVDLEEADGLNDLDNAVNRGDAGDLYPGTSNNMTFDDTSNPNSKDYALAATNLAVTSIGGPVNNRTFDIAVTECQLKVANVVVDDSPCGNNNGTLDSNEVADLQICLGNDFATDVTGAYGILSSLTAGVVVNSDSVFFGTVTCPTTNCGGANYVIEATVPLTAGQAVDFQLDVFGDAGYASTHTVTLSAGQYVLLVEDDGAANNLASYTTAITAAGYSFVHHDTGVSGSPTAGQMAGALAVLWYTGQEFDNTFTPTEQAAVSEYLDNGGALFVSGQDVGYDLADQGDAADQTFYEDYLHANFINDTSSDQTLTGVGGDPISAGLNLSLNGAVSTWPSVITPRAGATHVWVYNGTNYGAVRYETGHRLAYFAFILEAETVVGTFNTVIDNVLSYLIAGDVTPPTNTLNTPVGGNSYGSCDSLLVTWTAGDNVAVDECEVYLSSDSGATWNSVALLPGNPGSHSFLPGASGTTFRVKVIARDAGGLQGVDMNTTDFTLEDVTAPTVQVLDPNGGESLEALTQHKIIWNASDDCALDSAMVFVSLDNGSSWTSIATVAPGDTCFTWDVPDTTADSCLVRVDVQDDSGNPASDMSDAVFDIFQPVLGIRDEVLKAGRVALLQNFPNPMNRSTRFSFYLPEDAPVSLKVYDLKGRLIRTVVDATMPPGFHEQAWDGGTDNGRVASSGIYFYVLQTPNSREVKKLVRTTQ